ncbi:MAG: ABC transporter ATP-binding protein [Erysipelothrix sp.]|nr:ABC transporter ATP-binding protein [Erysipelothrix sp.]
MIRTKKEILLRMLSLLSPYRWIVLIISILSVAQVTLTLYLPVLIGQSIDLMISKGQVDFVSLQQLLKQMVIIIILNTLVQWILPRIYQKITYEITRDLRQATLEKLHSMPLSYIDRHSTGDLVSRLTTDTEQFNDGLLMIFEQLIIGLLTIIFTLVMMFNINVIMMIVVTLLSPISLLTSRFIANKSYEYFSSSAKQRGALSELVEESITQKETITLFNYHTQRANQFRHINDNYSDLSFKATFYSSTVNPTTRFINSLIYAGVTGIGALLILNASLSVGGLTVFLNYAKEYTKPFNDISNVFAELQSAMASANRLFDILDGPTELESGNHIFDKDNLSGDITFEHVDFSYDPNITLIEDLNLNVKAGQKVAIVGPTGAGKSTVINLLMRFYEVNSGHITLDQQKITDYTKASLRQQIGMVLQDGWIKSGSVADNIAYGFPNASREQVISAAKRAFAHQFIEALPQGYDTILESGGNSLSKGQQQLLSIARLFVSIPNVLILDEATSSIDTRTEIQIQKAFHALMEGRTSFVIAHRLSTIQDANLILVMDQGQVVEQGNHEELMNNKGLYYKMQMANNINII